ncbi:MAG TPA: altronate dehydratase family protein [Bryobacteraceae bacterium]|nr:altronate dehydratase family protein [Bryobacteraceae bacterium]
MSLVDITKAASAENAAILLHADDNVAIARVPLSPGQRLELAGRTVTVAEAIPPGHKVALAAVAAGENVLRYGQRIGHARVPIEAGRHVHMHNLAFEELTFDYEFPSGEIGFPALPANVPRFLGYAREDGRAGTRNYIAVGAASNCAAHTAELIARSYENERLPPNVDGVVAFPHGEGCAHSIGPDTRQLQRTIAGVLDHPNVAAALILGLGCEVNQVSHYLGGPRLKGLTLQESGGTRATVDAARREIDRFIEAAAACERTEIPASKIVLGLNCGGSDSFSGITANPALGVASDLLASYGGSPVLAETTEIFGAEHLLVRRARNREVAERLLARIADYRTYLNRFGGSFDDNPAPGNKEGGLSNILEKSLGAVAKGGTSPLMEVVDYAERVSTPGLVFMNTPGYDPVSLAGLAAGGANVIAFTTGRGSAIGFATIPVVKIATNSATYRRMRDNMEVNAGAITDGEKSVAEVGREIFDLVMRVASGERTASERLGHREFVPWRIGPVL